MGRACITHGEKMNAYRILVGKPEGKSRGSLDDSQSRETLKYGHESRGTRNQE
jgi:hypothetical protein